MDYDRLTDQEVYLIGNFCDGVGVYHMDLVLRAAAQYFLLEPGL